MASRHCEHVERLLLAPGLSFYVLWTSKQEVQRTIDTFRARCAMARILALFRPDMLIKRTKLFLWVPMMLSLARSTFAERSQHFAGRSQL